MPKGIYILSGLGADERAFGQMDFAGADVSFVKWVLPDRGESIEHYAGRLLPQITSPNPILIGLSFGGIVAIEMAKQIATEHVILIASVKTRNEIPFYYRWAGMIGIQKLLPTHLLKTANFITNWFFGATSEPARALLKRILADTDPAFLKWAINQIVCWRNTASPARLTHIHGTADRILPIRFVTPDIRINNGGHFMTWEQSEEISRLIAGLLSGF